MSIDLKDGTTAEDARLDRLVQFDERSRNFPVRAVAPRQRPRSYTWNFWPPPFSQHGPLDQGSEGACVGFACAHELMARPFAHQGITDELAIEFYHEAQHRDPWAGCYLGSRCKVAPSPSRYDGTSILAGIQTLQKRGYFSEYRWAFGLEDLIVAVSWTGPAILGLNWYEGMFTPDEHGYIHPTGRLMGGHAIMVSSVNVGGRFFRFPNSWGPHWHDNHGGRTTLRPGHARISFDDMERLLHENGEACIPTVRHFA